MKSSSLILIIASVLFSHTAFSAIKKVDLISGIDLRTDKKISFNTSEKVPTVYYFLSAWCPCSQGTFDHLNELQAKYKGFKFVGFHSSVAIPKDEALEYFAKYKIDFPIIQDKTVKYADLFKAVKTPHVFVVSPSGEILFQGGATNSRTPERATKFYLKDALASLSKGETPEITNAKAIGCYIQR